MQIHKVKLPSDSLIPYLKFCRLIADAIHPIDKDIKGIKCVIFKIYPPEAALGFVTELTYALADKDMQELGKLLPKLPPLHYGMPEAEVDLFMQAYANLPKRPVWTPVIASEKTAFEHKYKHKEIMDRHLQLMREERRAGRLVPVDATHVVLDAVQIGAHISSQDAIAYLKRHGLEYDNDEIGNPISKKGQSFEKDRKSLTLKDKETIVKLHKKYTDEKRPKPTLQIAELFNVSTRRITSIVKEAKEAKEAEKKQPSLDSVWRNVMK
jgi:hypothetical protein